MSKTITFILQRCLTERDAERLGLPYLMSCGHRVVVVDCGKLIFPMIADDRGIYDHWRHMGIEVEVYDKAADIAGLPSLLDRADMTICEVGSGYVTPANLPILRALSRSRTPWGLFMLNPSPALTRPPDWVARPRPGEGRSRLKRLRHQLLTEPANAILNRLPLSVLGVRAADFAICGGRASLVPRRVIGPGTKIVLAHSQDYEAFLDPTPEVAQEDVAVYLDQAFGYHPDTLERKIGSVVTPDIYYPRLRRLFDRIESELGLRVIVAAHPRLPAAQMREIFGDREVAINQSLAMVRRSRLVINSFSTSVCWAVLLRRPVLSIASTELLTHPLLTNMVEFASGWLDQKPVLIDDPESVQLFPLPEVDNSVYDRFILEFVKQDTKKDKRIWEIIFDYFK